MDAQKLGELLIAIALYYGYDVEKLTMKEVTEHAHS